MSALRDLLFHLARLAAGAVFLYAAALKVANIDAFAGNVAAYQLLPYSYNYLVAAILPYVEMITGILLLFNVQVRPASLLLMGLNLLFIVVLASAIWRGLDIDCGCFQQSGGGEHVAPLAALLRDVGLMVLLLISYAWRPEPRRGIF